MSLFHASPRNAGLLYLIIILAGLSAELLLRGPAVEALAIGVAPVETLIPAFRLSALADLVMLMADVCLALVFFTLLSPISDGLARMAMVFRLMQAALIGMSLTLIAAVPDALAQGNASLALQLTAMHATGYDVGLILFGINSLIMARLLILARAVPRIIALGIGASGLVYMTGSTLRLAAPELLTVFEPAYGIPMLAETALALWLLITGRLVRAALQAGPPYPREAARERPSTHR